MNAEHEQRRKRAAEVKALKSTLWLIAVGALALLCLYLYTRG